MNIAIVLCFNESSTQVVKSIQKRLVDAGLNTHTYQAKTPPHITLAGFDIEPSGLETLKLFLSGLTTQLNFKLRCSSFGSVK